VVDVDWRVVSPKSGKSIRRAAGVDCSHGSCGGSAQREELPTQHPSTLINSNSHRRLDGSQDKGQKGMSMAYT
jgi:hypothetical protein